jgi:hypothetical protein
MNEMRRYYLLLNTFSEGALEDYGIPTEVSDHAQQVFVEVRKGEHEAKGEVKTNADTFHQWLTLGRLLAISEGRLALTKEHFDKARDMERERLSRIAANIKPK